MNKNKVLLIGILVLVLVGVIFYASPVLKPLFAQYSRLGQMASPAAVSLEKILGVQSKLLDKGLEGPVEVLGQIFLTHGDSVDGSKSDDFYFLKDEKTNKIYELKSDKKFSADVVTGTKVKVRGNAKSNIIEVEGLDGESEGITIIEEAETLVSMDNRRVLVIPANFSDRNLSCTSGQLNSFYFNQNQASIATTYPEVTNGAVGFFGDTLAPASLSYSYASTDYMGWAYELNQYAISLGYNLADYDHVSYVVPANGTGYGGLGDVNGKRSWIFYCSPAIVQHELGHNLGLAHASTLSHEYGDRSDAMGNPSGYQDFNAPHKNQLNWVSDSSIIDVTDQNSGLFTLSPIDYPVDKAPHPYMLRLLNPNSITGPLGILQDSYYYISYRVGEGVTSNLSTEYKDKIHIHTYRGSGYANTYLIKTLNPGESFTDVDLGLNIVFNNKTIDTAVVDVSYSCVVQKPAVSITPTIYSTNNTEAKTYEITVKNTQTASCAPETYDLSLSLPDGWTYDNTFASQTISSGQSITKDVSITPSGSTTEGKYDLEINVSGQNGSSVQSVVTYELDLTSPSVPENLQGSYKQKKVTLTWADSTDVGGVSHYNIYRNDSLLNNSTTASYIDSAPITGVNVYYVTAVDEVGNESSPSTTVSIDTGTTGGGGGGKGKPSDGGGEGDDGGSTQKSNNGKKPN